MGTKQLAFFFTPPKPTRVGLEETDTHAKQSVAPPQPRPQPKRVATEDALARPTIPGKIRVEQILRAVLGPKTMVTLTENRSTMISYRSRRGVLYVRIHSIFSEASDKTLEAVGRYIGGTASARDCTRIDRWIENNRSRLPRTLARVEDLQPIGLVYDLRLIFAQLNQRYFQDRVRAQITWGRAPRKKRRNSIRLGSYCDERRLIRLHPALDQDFVPRYFVESVVFHEMLHERHGVEEHPGERRCIHTPNFLKDERQFHAYERARRWEAKNLPRLLRY